MINKTDKKNFEKTALYGELKEFLLKYDAAHERLHKSEQIEDFVEGLFAIRCSVDRLERYYTYWKTYQITLWFKFGGKENFHFYRDDVFVGIVNDDFDFLIKIDKRLKLDLVSERG